MLFKKISIFILFLLLFVSCGKNTEIKWLGNNEIEKAFEISQKKNRFLLVDCYASKSSFSYKMDNEVYATSNVIHAINDKFVPLRVVLTNSTEKDDRFFSNYSIGVFPTTLVFSPSGLLLDRIIGYIEVRDFYSYLMQIDQRLSYVRDIMSNATAGVEGYKQELLNFYMETGDAVKMEATLKEIEDTIYEQVLPVYYSRLISLYFDAGNYEKSISYAESMEKRFPTSGFTGQGKFLRGIMLEEMKGRQEAINYYKSLSNSHLGTKWEEAIRAMLSAYEDENFEEGLDINGNDISW